MNPYPSERKAILRFLILCSFLLGYPVFVVAQANIISFSPASVLQGEQQQIVVKAIRTHFKQGQSHVDLGQGLTVQTITVTDQETMLVQAVIDNSAVPGSRTVIIVTNNETVRLGNAFQVLARQGFNLAFTLYPAQYLSASYFDPKHIQSSPQLFAVKVTNNAVARDLSLIVTIISPDYGTDPLITGRANFPVQAGATLNLNNKQFTYSFTNTSMEPFETSTQTGNLPGGLYYFRLQAFDRGNVISDNNAVIQITNPMDKPELIYPGSSFFYAPMQIQNLQPLFQWTGQATSYDIAIYPVKQDQIHGEETVLNRPVFEEKGISQNSFLYPAYASPLEEGKAYSWQLTTHNYGVPPLKSELKWFKILNTGVLIKPVNITRIMVGPEDVVLKPGGSCHFNLYALNGDKDTVKINPLWKVVPSDAGTIDEYGNFTASKLEKEAVAIIGMYGELTDYVTLTIKSPLIRKKKIH